MSILSGIVDGVETLLIGTVVIGIIIVIFIVVGTMEIADGIIGLFSSKSSMRSGRVLAGSRKK